MLPLPNGMLPSPSTRKTLDMSVSRMRGPLQTLGFLLVWFVVGFPTVAPTIKHDTPPDWKTHKGPSKAHVIYDCPLFLILSDLKTSVVKVMYASGIALVANSYPV